MPARLTDAPVMPGRCVELFLAAQAVRGLSPRTIARRRWVLNLFVEYLDGACLADVDAELLEGFLARYPVAQTRQSIRSDINQLYRFGVRRGLVDGVNPCDLVDAPRLPSKAATPIPAVDVRRAIEAARPEVRLMVMLAAYAGLRVSEIARLRGDDVDLEARVLAVRCGKGARDATVPVADELAAELARWPARGRYFPGLDGAAVSSRIRYLFRKLAIPARPHDLRHSFGTEAARRSGGNMVLVQQLMRHESIASTRRYVGWHPVGLEIVSGLYGVSSSTSNATSVPTGL